MSIGANSYGTAAGVAAMVPRWAAGDGFVSSARPTLAQVEGFIDQVSGLVNSMLAEAGFTIPVTDDDAKDMLDLFVNMEVSTMCDGVNGSGRFGPSDKSGGGRGRFSLLMDDVSVFIMSNKAGLERLGVARSYSATAGFSFRDIDNAGDETFPIFTRNAFNNLFVDSDPV